MKKIITYLGLPMCMVIALSCSSIAQTPTLPTKFLLLEYGLPDPSPGARMRTAAKWGIEFRLLAGCMIPQTLIDSINRENSKVERLIEKKYGKLWREDLNKEVHEEQKHEQVITDLLNPIAYIQQAKKETAAQGAGLNYFFTPVEGATYKVSVEGWGKWNGEAAYLKFYELQVDYVTKTIQVLNSKRSKK